MTALTVDTVREQLTAHLEAGQSYPFLTSAEPYLRACGDDHYIRLMAVREYLKLGLPVPARELLAKGASFPDAPAEFSALAAELRGIRGVTIAWESRRERFERNLKALNGRLDSKVIRRAWESDRLRFQLFRDAHGFEQVRMRDECGDGWWIPALSQHATVDAAHPMPEGVTEHMPGPYLFEGLDQGGYFERVYHATRNTFLCYSCALFVVEPDPALFALVLHLRDWEKILGDPSVFWIVGEDWEERLRQGWAENFDLPWPRQAFVLSTFRRGGPAGSVEVVRQAGAEREQTVRDSLADLETRYSARDRAYWSSRFSEALSGHGGPLRILAAVSTHTTFLQYSMRDVQRALQSLGHSCMVLTETTPFTVVGPLTFHKAIRELDPDFFLSIDHLRPEFASLIPTNLPILTWDQDQLPHVFTQENMRQVGSQDYVVGCSKSKWVLMGCNPRQYLHARLPTCPEQFSGSPLTSEEQARYGCDVSFVSHTSQTPLAFHEEQRAACSDVNLAGLLDVLYEMLPAALATHVVAAGPLTDSLLDEACARRGVLVTNPNVISWIRSWYLWRLADRLFRHEALEWVADWARRGGRNFRIYGNGWDQHPTLREFAAGPAANGRELLCVYRASRINLQLMPAGFIHQRALDGLAAGGFFLARRVPHDFRGRILRRLDQRIQDLGIVDTAELLANADPEVRADLGAFCGDWLGRINRNDLFQEIRLNAELTYPDEEFADFDGIVFDSRESFARTADRFLADDELRLQTAGRMRSIVIERFSYQSAMARFLTEMAAYLTGE